MPFNQMGTGPSVSFGTYNDVQGNQHNSMIYQSNTVRTPQQLFFVPEIRQPRLPIPMLPSPPELLIGRDREKADVMNTLLQQSPARVAILGGGGMGKTTLALSILHEDAIVERYSSRYFVSCEGVSSVLSLLEKIARALQIPTIIRDSFLINTVFSSFPDKTLLCLDNFETLWNDEATRPEIEEFLSMLQREVLGLIITMRGAQRPSRVSWSKSFLPPLPPLTMDISRRVFEEMTKGSVDEFAGKLLTAVDGIPLAISLISDLLGEGLETSESLWSRWTKTGSGSLESGGKHRLSSLDTSIRLSVFEPRMRADPTTIDILVMLSILPDGFPDEERAVVELQSHLPEGYNLRKALLTMGEVSLVHIDGTTAPRRLRMLSPIQSFCQGTLEGSEKLRNSITSFYVQMMNRFPNPADPNGHKIIPGELRNVHAVLIQAWRRGKGDVSLTVASIEFTLWSTYLGNHVEDLIYAAMQGAFGEPDLQGNCHRAVGELYLGQFKLDDAEKSLKHAAELHQQAHNVLGEGNDLQTLGEVYLRRDRLDEAEESFRRAAELHQQAHDVLGEGNNLQKLGAVYLRRNQLDEAEESFRTAAGLHRKAFNVPGEGNDLQKLGEVHLRRDQLDKAEELFKHAAELHQLTHDVLGEANDFHHLGRVFLQQDRLDEGKASFQRAAELHHWARDVLGEADDLQRLGRVHFRRDELGEAEVSFKYAARLHQQAHDILGEGDDLWMLKRVHLRRSKLCQINNFAPPR